MPNTAQNIQDIKNFRCCIYRRRGVKVLKWSSNVYDGLMEMKQRRDRKEEENLKSCGYVKILSANISSVGTNNLWGTNNLRAMLQPYYLLQLLQKQTDSLMEVSCLEPPPSVPQGNFLSGESHLTAKPLAKQSWRFSHWSFLPPPVPAITQELIWHNAPVKLELECQRTSRGKGKENQIWTSKVIKPQLKASAQSIAILKCNGKMLCCSETARLQRKICQGTAGNKSWRRRRPFSMVFPMQLKYQTNQKPPHQERCGQCWCGIWREQNLPAFYEQKTQRNL